VTAGGWLCSAQAHSRVRMLGPGVAAPSLLYYPRMPTARSWGKLLLRTRVLRRGDPRADPIEALQRTWSRYAQVWDRRPDLNLGVKTLGEEWGGPAFAQRILAQLAAPYLGPEVDVLELNLASPGGTWHFEAQYGADTWSRPFDDAHRLGRIHFMSEDQLRHLTSLARFSVDRRVTDWPPPDDPMRGVNWGRDAVGFLRREDGFLEQAGDSMRLVKASGDQVYAIVDERRRAIPSAEIFEGVGFRWEDIEPIDDTNLAGIPEDYPITGWES
jgi:hypothetical protein